MLVAEEVVKMVIAVICLSFLVYLLATVYYSNADSQNKEKAQSVVDRIDEAVNAVSIDKSTSFEITDVSPSGWNFFSFVGDDKKPNSCANENCLCICEKVSFDDFLIWKDRQISKCDDDGVCLSVTELKKFETFEIRPTGNGGTSVNVSYNGGIEIKEI